MTDWLILISVKALKLAIMGTLAVASQFASDDDRHVRLSYSAATEFIGPTQLAVPKPGEFTGPIAFRAVRTSREERIRRLVPPIRVEMMFTPDLLTPPSRDLSL